MSGLGTATTQELGADDEVKEYQEEEDINEVDESLNDIKSELEQHAETYKSKTAVHSPPANVVATTRAVQASQQTFVLGQVNSALIPGRLPVFGTPQALDPSKRMLPMAQVYTIPGLQSMPVKMEAIPTSNNSYCVSSSSAVYPSYPAGIPVVPTTPGYPYVLGNPYVSVQLQQQMLNNQSGVMAGVHGMVPSNQPAPEKKKPHVKKPLNAFMLFMREKRAEVMKECSLKESAAINQILGKKWHALTKEEQEKYYELARQERAKHLQLYPGWSARDNYAIHKKRKRRKPMKEEEVEIDPNAKKCRARYGMEQQHMWCQPCRRKKRCARYGEGEGEDDDDCELADNHSEQNKINNKSVPLEPVSVSQGAPQGAPQPNGTTLSVSPDAHSDPPSNSQGLVPIAT